ncbi:gliding motility-associated C-terminal domain-containing protein [Hufsiella ginkgonis]|uniref:T9SS type B sorting domain-containing protein n=1 Tax=Hufsiella ginkgonis TaxID=2695274 RepID=A0A7K1XUW0_9SPHI|nr:gliding motility-associated C-terminal domain-containing protein [Hufsiella ginkgonis]MXV14587.1 T9SS type B sorting domain-containing protein [Hufsiella ginkgonis]
MAGDEWCNAPPSDHNDKQKSYFRNEVAHLRTICMLVLTLLCQRAHSETIPVTTANDSGPGSLRAALTQAAANGSADWDLVSFNLPGAPPDWVIFLLSALPAVSAKVVIDGTTQPGVLNPGPNARISLVRSSTDFFHGLFLNGCRNVEIYGMIFQNFKSGPTRFGGICLKNAYEVVIGKPGGENVFINNGVGIYSSEDFGDTGANIKIAANYVGVTADGAAASPNQSGIDLSWLENVVIGGADPREGNIVCGNTVIGIGCGGFTGINLVENNLVGVSRDGTRTYPVDKATGIFVSGAATFNIVKNTVGVQEKGILLQNVSKPFRVQRNHIGTGPSENEPLGNKLYGIQVLNCPTGVIGGPLPADKNVITNNDYAIYLELDVSRVTITLNSIFCNKKDAIVFNRALTVPPLVTLDRITATGASGTYQPGALIELFYDDNCPNCEGKTYIATATADAAGRWSYTGALTGSLLATGTVNGSTSAFSKPTFVVSSAQIGPAYCNGSTGFIRNITATGATQFEWRNALNEIVATSLALENAPAGTYYLRAGQPGGCLLETQRFVIDQKVISYEISGTNIVPASCFKNNGQVVITAFKSDTPLSYKWLNSAGAQVGTGRDLKDVAAGEYTLVCGNMNGCENVAGKFTVPQAGALDISLANIVKEVSCEGNVSLRGIRVSGGGTPYSYAWKNEAGATIGTAADLPPSPPGAYFLTVTDTYDCTASSGEIRLTGNDGAGIKVPNNFTPNGDGINDTWNITGVQFYPSGSFKLFNRYGEQVFSSKGYATPFNGTLNGKPLPVGTYYYLIKLSSCPPLTGRVTIMR